MAKQGSIKHYRQTGAAKAPPSLPFGELAVAKDGTLFVGSASNAAIPAGVQVYTHAYDAVAKRHNFTGSGGENGRALVTASVKPGDSFAVNGKAVAAYIGGDEADELPVGRWVSFIFDGTQLNFKGGGSGLNFKVIAAASVSTLPAIARENTIAIINSAAVTDWQFCAAQPAKRSDGGTLSGGEVWFKTTSTSMLAFNALRKNSIMLYPLTCYQYKNGVWVYHDARSFQNNAWIPWISYFYNSGTQYVAMNANGYRSGDNRNYAPYASINANNITFGVYSTWLHNPGTAVGACCWTSGKIDLTGRNTLYIDCNVTQLALSGYGYLGFGVGNTVGSWGYGSHISTWTTLAFMAKTGRQLVGLDISAVNSGYIGAQVNIDTAYEGGAAMEVYAFYAI